MNQGDRELLEKKLIDRMNPKFHDDGRRILKELLEDRDKQIEELSLAICPDGSITNHKELIDFSKDLQHAYDKLSDVMMLYKENMALKEQIEHLEIALLVEQRKNSKETISLDELIKEIDNDTTT